MLSNHLYGCERKRCFIFHHRVRLEPIFSFRFPSNPPPQGNITPSCKNNIRNVNWISTLPQISFLEIPRISWSMFRKINRFLSGRYFRSFIERWVSRNGVSVMVEGICDPNGIVERGGGVRSQIGKRGSFENRICNLHWVITVEKKQTEHPQ